MVLAGQSHMQLRVATTHKSHLQESGIVETSLGLGMLASLPLFPTGR